MNFVCIVFELGDKMLTLSSMENLIVQCNRYVESPSNVQSNVTLPFLIKEKDVIEPKWRKRQTSHHL